MKNDLKDHGAASGTNAPENWEVSNLKPTYTSGAIFTVSTLTLFIGGLLLALEGKWLPYLCGQILLAIFFVSAFVLLHEAGHNTLFPRRELNFWVGHFAGFLTLIPFWNWQRIHARHHRYTGWQDLDATTASLVPRVISPWERRIINFCWRSWLPVFALTYRIQNFWNLPRILRYVINPKSRRLIVINTLGVSAGYVAILMTVGPFETFKLIGPAFLLSLVVQESLILSQHTHVPQRVSGGRTVRPFSPLRQASFTRSLRLPGLVSTMWMHFDAHELHHMYPFVPGYRLRQIDFQPENEVDWLCWIKAARGLRGTDFLFRNWDETGMHV